MLLESIGNEICGSHCISISRRRSNPTGVKSTHQLLSVAPCPPPHRVAQSQVFQVKSSLIWFPGRPQNAFALGPVLQLNLATSWALDGVGRGLSFPIYPSTHPQTPEALGKGWEEVGERQVERGGREGVASPLPFPVLGIWMPPFTSLIKRTTQTPLVISIIF